MICPNCQYEDNDGMPFCRQCGVLLHPSESPTASLPQDRNSAREPLTPGTTYANRYQVIEKLGEGGMGQVYKAFDTELKEIVCLKLINSKIASQKKTIDRFRNEIRLARRISHRNICRVYHLSEEQGACYMVMEYVPGRDLKSMIKMTRELSLATAVRISKQVCNGLSEAHRCGVIHRDLKPSNILIDREGHVRIMDFGIARSLEANGITASGVIVGTPQYMSPEQVETNGVDHRSDIYSLGVILYEMVTGRLPFEGETSLSIALKHKSEKPPNPQRYNPQIPDSLSRVILKCMEKDKEKRYQSTEELCADLTAVEEEIGTTEIENARNGLAFQKEPKVIFRKRWLMIAALFIAMKVVGITVPQMTNEKPLLLPENKMLVVLPFENMGSAEDEYFVDGITDEITSRLSALDGIEVISRTSAARYRQTNKTTRQIGDELGVEFFVEGAVQWDRTNGGSGRVRVTTQLVRVSDDTHIWASTYDRVIGDIFSVQSEIAEEVAKNLDLTVLAPERKALYAKPTTDLEAYDCYLRAKKHENKGWANQDSQEFNKALELLAQAVERDPDFALAYISMSQIYTRMYHFGTDRTNECLTKARAAIDKALELQPNLPEAKIAEALYYYRGHLDYERASEIYKSVLKARPNLSPDLLGYIQRRQGKWEQCLATLEEAFKFDPRSPQLAYEIGLTYLALRRYDKAGEWFEQALAIDPNRLTPLLGKITISVLSKGTTEEARAQLETLPNHPLTDYMGITLSMLVRDYQSVLDKLSSLTYDSFLEQHFYFHKDLTYAAVYRALRDFSRMEAHAESARTLLEKMVNENSGDTRYRAALGLAYAYSGLKEEAIQEGERAVSLHSVAKDAAQGPIYVLNLARIYLIVGEFDKALNQLEYLLSIPSCEFLWQLVSEPLLRIDPLWDPLRDQPRFQSLLEQQP